MVKWNSNHVHDRVQKHPIKRYPIYQEIEAEVSPGLTHVEWKQHITGSLLSLVNSQFLIHYPCPQIGIQETLYNMLIGEHNPFPVTLLMWLGVIE